MSDKTKYMSEVINNFAGIYQSLGESQEMETLTEFFSGDLLATPIINFSSRVDSILESMASNHNTYDIFLGLVIQMGMVVDMKELGRALTLEVNEIQKNEFFDGVMVNLVDPVIIALFFIRLYNNKLLSDAMLIGQSRGITK